MQLKNEIENTNEGEPLGDKKRVPAGENPNPTVDAKARVVPGHGSAWNATTLFYDAWPKPYDAHDAARHVQDV